MRFFYLDPGLHSELGHHSNYCRLICGALRARGVETVVLAFDKVERTLQSEFGAIPYFRNYTYWTTDGDPICGWLSGFQTVAAQTREDLTRLSGIKPSDIVYMNSAQPAQLMAMAEWLEGLAPERLPPAMIEFATDTGLDREPTAEGMRLAPCDPRLDPRAVLYRLAAKRLPKDRSSPLHLITFDRSTSAAFAALLERSVLTLPMPYPAVTSRRLRAGKRPIVVSVLGHQRPEKGYHLMPEIAAALLRSRQDIRLFVHNGDPAGMSETQQALREIAASEARLIMDESLATLARWSELLEQSDLVLCPYFPARYFASHSGIVAEAAANAIPLVVPAGTALDSLLHELGGPGTVFDRFDAPSIVDATLRALADFDRHASLAHAAAARWPERHGPDRLVEAMLALPAGPRQ